MSFSNAQLTTLSTTLSIHAAALDNIIHTKLSCHHLPHPRASWKDCDGMIQLIRERWLKEYAEDLANPMYRQAFEDLAFERAIVEIAGLMYRYAASLGGNLRAGKLGGHPEVNGPIVEELKKVEVGALEVVKALRPESE